MKTLLFDTLNAYTKKTKLLEKIDNSILTTDVALKVAGFQGSFLAYYTARLFRNKQSNMLIILPSEREAEDFGRDLDVFGVPYNIFPWYGSVPYSSIPKGSVVHGQRSRILAALAQHDNRKQMPVHICSMRSLLSPLPKKEWIAQRIHTVQKGQQFDPYQILEVLNSLGYERVHKVSLKGEFALRGEVLDIFLPGDQNATRIVFDFDKIDDIREFDITNQSSINSKTELVIYPSREVIWDEERLLKLKENLSNQTEYNSAVDQIISCIEEPYLESEDEYWYPLSFQEKTSLCDYLPENTIVFCAEYERLVNTAQGIFNEFESTYRKQRIERSNSYPLPKPEFLLLDFQKVLLSGHKYIFSILLSGKESPDIQIHYNGPRSFFGNIDYLKDEIEVLAANDYQIMVCADNDVQQIRIEHMLGDMPVTVLPESLQSGFSLPEVKLIVLQEHEIFGRRKRSPVSAVPKSASKEIETFIELEPGDLVVHVNHGIGRFCGIQRIKAAGNERDYVHLEYAGDEFLYIPIEQVNLVQKYIGQDSNSVKLDTIGGKSWQNRKTKVKKSVADLAERLIALYSKRKKIQGFAFPPDTEWQNEFEALFPYQETVDQLRCIEEVKADMEQPFPMDRLICGDVGFGKTEIALRAAFKAVASGKQVALLAPTTILAEQHFETLSERIGRFPVRIGMLSRFVSPADQKKIIKGLIDGSIDIVIGTHRILSKDVLFKDLGLIIVDEEQRFGVTHKERLKEIRASVDSLTLSATPIPRTLHMSLLKIRDMSILQSPPGNRMPISTVIHQFDEVLIAKAVRKEIERGGQVYFLHNRIETLDYIKEFIEKLVPEAMVDTAHGQMSARSLEEIMHRFIHGAFQVLVATTIVENGIDIPNVNTIIIDRADNFGISQLYQLRGRVGRSDRLAYAYLMYPENKPLSEIAMKRLQIISDHTELGSGFKVAMKDLEVRGAGNLLGPQQSGDIMSVGFDLYLRLLDEAIQHLQSTEDDWNYHEIYLELDYSGFIPDSYIEDTMEKMEVYKKIASINTEDEMHTITTELVDRFGPMPEEVLSLLALAEIRILCRLLKISTLKERNGIVTITFERVAQLDVNKVIEAIRISGGTLKPDPKNPQNLLMLAERIGLKEKSEFIREKLSSLL